MVLAFAIAFLPLAAAAATPFVSSRLNRHIGWWAVAVALATFVLELTFLPAVSGGESFYYSISWVPSLGVELSLTVDGLSLLFSLLVSGIGLLIFIYSCFYMSAQEKLGRFYAYMLFFMGSMLGTVLSANLILLFVFWELMSLSCYFLIGFWDEEEECRKAANKALLVTVLGGLAMLAGFVLLYIITGSFELREVLARADLVRGSPLYPIALVLILAGAFSKSAQLPFHIWLPGAMVAPTPVSAYLHAATMVNAGIFLIARFYPVFSGSELWFYLITSIGVATMLTGAYHAVRQCELKALLAYSTISQLGLIVALLGFSTQLGVLAAMFHLVTHAVFKGALFLVVGAVDHGTGTRLIRRLAGLARSMPYTAALAGITALSMAGIPPLSGFLSKETFYDASLHLPTLAGAAWLLPLLAVGGSIMTLVYSLRIFHGVFFGASTRDTLHAHEAPRGMLLPVGILAGVCILIGIYPSLVLGWLVEPAVTCVVQGSAHHNIALWHGFNLPLMMSIITIVLGLAFYFRLRNALRVQQAVNSRLSADHIYDKWILGFLVRGTVSIFNRFQSGYLRHYLMIIMVFLLGLTGYTLVTKAGFSLPGFDLSHLQIYEYALAGLMIAAALATVLARERLAAIVALGALGGLIVVFWVVYSAPDLALTQLLIEIVSVILFVLVFFHALPFIKARVSRRASARDALIAVSFGGLITVLMLLAIHNPIFPSISDYYAQNALVEAGAKNIVNVIIVDFRGYDTMGEITVLAVSAIALFCVHRLRKREKE
ncbi:hydrogen gas-evolving membrane-bound hydrogenase subunit E [Chloroflexota bacterium]